MSPRAALLRRCRALELNDITVRIGDIDRRSLSLGAIPGGNRPGFETMGFQMGADAGFIERFYTQAEMIQIACLFSGRRTTGTAEFAVDWHQVNEGLTGTKLDQTNFVAPALDRAAEDVAVEVQHAIEADHPEHQMVDFANRDHRRG